MLCFHPMVMNNLYNQVRSYLRIDTGVKERKYGFKDACSRLVELDETIQLPAGYKMANSDRNDNVEGCSAFTAIPFGIPEYCRKILNVCDSAFFSEFL